MSYRDELMALVTEYGDWKRRSGDPNEGINNCQLWFDKAGDTLTRIEAKIDEQRVAVLGEVIAALEPEIAWQREAYGDGSDKVGMGRLIGMEDALRTIHEAAKR